jgi:hypothetical protein
VPPGKILLRSNTSDFGGDNDPSQPETLIVEE